MSDYHHQVFCFGRYIEREGHNDLTEAQSRVRQKLRKHNGNVAEAAASLKVTPQNILGHVAHIRAKGWSVSLLTTTRGN